MTSPRSIDAGVAGRILRRRLSRIDRLLTSTGRDDAHATLYEDDDPITRSEAVAQAETGLMYVHGLERGAPRRLGIDVASLATGVLATSAVIAGELGRARGIPAPRLRASLPAAGLLFLTTRIARETRAEQAGPLPLASSAEGFAPPFRTSDGHRFELEALEAVEWQTFWHMLDVRNEFARDGWRPFLQRYAAGWCRLPRELHDATAARPLAAINSAAAASGVSVCRLRSNREVVASSDWKHVSLPRLRVIRNGGAGTASATNEMARAVTGDALPPLYGMRVIEATSRTQGPLAGQLLRMLGADVAHIEPPGGDPSRLETPLTGGAGAYFVSVNRDKSSIELDLRSAGGRDTLLELVNGADIFLHNWRPGRAEEWRLDATSLSRVSPRLVYCAASGWGDQEPAGDPIGVDYLVQAHTGLADSLTPVGEPPSPSRVLLADTMGAIVACEGALTGLLQRERTGAGCSVSTSLLAGAMALQDEILVAMQMDRERGRRDGRPLLGSLDQPIPTADGYLAIDMAANDAAHRLYGVCDLAGDRDSAETRDARLAQRIAADTSRHWENVITSAGIPCSVVCTDIASLQADSRITPYLERVENTWVPASPWRAET